MTPEQKAADRFKREVSAHTLRRRLTELKEELNETSIKVPPRFANLVADFQHWLNTTYPK